jgi:hypothetical protein
MQKNNNKGVLKRIKWENIFTIIMIIFDLYAIYSHIELNGFYSELGLEFIIYFGLTFGFRYVIKDMRLNFKEWFSIFFE